MEATVRRSKAGAVASATVTQQKKSAVNAPVLLTQPSFMGYDGTMTDQLRNMYEFEYARANQLEQTVNELRDWCYRGMYPDGPTTDWQRGFLAARTEVRRIIERDEREQPDTFVYNALGE